MVGHARTRSRGAGFGWRVRTLVAGVLGLVLTLTGLGFSSAPAHAADFKLGIDKSVDDPKSSYDVGDTVTYRIRIKCDSLTTPCGSATVEDILDTNLSYGSYSINRLGSGEEASTAPITLTRTGQKLVFTVGDASNEAKYFQDGETLELVITTTITGVPSNAGSTIANQATITASDVTTVSDPVSITVDKPVIDWKLRKTRVWPPSSVDPAVGGEVTYQLQFYRDKSTGGVPIDSAVLTDTLPAGATFVNAWADYPSLTGVHSGNKVTFTLPANTDLSPSGNSFSAYVTVSYPASAGFKTGDKVTNTASADVTYDTGEKTLPTGTLTASADVTLADPKGASSSNKWSNLYSPASPGGSVTWTVQGHNTGNVILGTYVSTDHLPDGIHDVKIVPAESWWMPTMASNQKVTFEYSTDGTTWTAGFT